MKKTKTKKAQTRIFSSELSDSGDRPSHHKLRRSDHRSSNPGPQRGRKRFYHKTTDACRQRVKACLLFII